MKDLKMKKIYQVTNLIGAVICGLILAAFIAWMSASDEIKHPSCSGENLDCFKPFGALFLDFLKDNLLLCVGSFLAANVIQLIISLRYFSKYNGIFIGLLGTIIFFISTVISKGFTLAYFRFTDIFAIASVSLIFSLVMFLTLLPIFGYEKIKQKQTFR